MRISFVVQILYAESRAADSSAAPRLQFYDINKSMRNRLQILGCLLLLADCALGQGKRLWVLRTSGEMVEYDPSTFAVKQTIKVPPEAAQSPQRVFVNLAGQVLFVPAVSLPLSDEDAAAQHKAFLWNGQKSATLDLGVKRELGKAGSNQVVDESAPTIAPSEDGTRLFWFANQARRLNRETVDLSTSTTWQSWTTDLNGENRADLATVKMPECGCSTGSCEETCPYGIVWTPVGGVARYFFMTQFVAGQTGPVYKSTTRYEQENGKWTAIPTTEPLQQLLDAASGGSVVIEAIPDSACCGWSNQSDDQTLLLTDGKKQTIFDEVATYANSDYDVSFSTLNAKFSPTLSSVAMTIVSTAKANQPIQLAEQGQANPEESKHIRTALADLPAVEVKTLGDTAKRIAFVPHATLVGWLDEKEILIVEDRVLVAYNVATGARRKSTVRAEDAGRVFLR